MEDEIVKPTSTKERKTGLIYDPRMLKHTNLFNPNHPEVPDRIRVTWDHLESEGLKQKCKILTTREATEEEILLVHSKEHYVLLSTSTNMEKENLFNLGGYFNSVFLNNHSYEVAKVAAGCVLELTEQVVTGQVSNGMALVRPPGHHAECKYAMGFSLFNSVAIAAKYAVEKLGLKRVLIVDWDIHHGNGTQHMFYEDSRVLYFSLHRFDNGSFYPFHDDAGPTYVGEDGSACGFNVNVAWNKDKMGDSEYLSAFHHLLMPIALEFNPELVLVSCGFDAAMGDPLGGYSVTPAGYAHMTHLLMSLANGKLVYALEGGYNVSAISKSTNNIVETLLGGYPLPLLEPLCPCESALKSISETGRAHSPYWKSMHMFSDYKTTAVSLEDVASVSPVLAIHQSAEVGQGPPTNNLEEMKKLHLAESVGVASGDETQAISSSDVGASSISGTTHLTATQQGIVESLGGGSHTEMFVVTPLTWCKHLSDHVKPLPPGGIDARQCCEICGEEEEAWVCLNCYHTFCGRYVNQHMLEHQDTAGHKVVISLADISVWCFECDSYLDNEVLQPAKNAVHLSKFGCVIGEGV